MTRADGRFGRADDDGERRFINRRTNPQGEREGGDGQREKDVCIHTHTFTERERQRDWPRTVVTSESFKTRFNNVETRDAAAGIRVRFSKRTRPDPRASDGQTQKPRERKKK